METSSQIQNYDYLLERVIDQGASRECLDVITESFTTIFQCMKAGLVMTTDGEIIDKQTLTPGILSDINNRVAAIHTDSNYPGKQIIALMPEIFNMIGFVREPIEMKIYPTASTTKLKANFEDGIDPAISDESIALLAAISNYTLNQIRSRELEFPSGDVSIEMLFIQNLIDQKDLGYIEGIGDISQLMTNN